MVHGINSCEHNLMDQIGMIPMEFIMAATKVSTEYIGWGK